MPKRFLNICDKCWKFDKPQLTTLSLTPWIGPSGCECLAFEAGKKVGADLFHRSTRKVALSIQGAEFLPFAREILAQEDAARAALGHGNSEVTGTLRFAASSTFAQLFIAPILPELLENYPGVNLELKFSDTQMNLIEGGFDLALRNYAIEESGLKARKLADDQRILCASPEYLAQHGNPGNPEELAGHQFLVFMNGPASKLTAKVSVFIDFLIEKIGEPPIWER